MPELPEVETVRAGLARWVRGRTIAEARTLHPRAVRRHLAGPADLESRLAGRTVSAIERRGKYLWLCLSSHSTAIPASIGPAELASAVAGQVGDDCLIAHLGMSGQLLLVPAGTPDGTHLRARFAFTDCGPELRFVDQRTFGGVQLDELVADGPTAIPRAVAHIARDPLDPLFSEDRWIASLATKRTTLKRVLLDQTSVSGVGNIYADEALWRAKLHGDRPVAALRRAQLSRLLAELRLVLHEALAAGGTSFDSLYVNVNGQSGYFDRSLNAYGRAGRACRRCSALIVRAKWMNRSSHFCPRCQPPPRPAAAEAGDKSLRQIGR